MIIYVIFYIAVLASIYYSLSTPWYKYTVFPIHPNMIGFITAGTFIIMAYAGYSFIDIIYTLDMWMFWLNPILMVLWGYMVFARHQYLTAYVIGIIWLVVAFVLLYIHRNLPFLLLCIWILFLLFWTYRLYVLNPESLDIILNDRI